jgi:D-alanyl-D-alanine dipeptidase
VDVSLIDLKTGKEVEMPTGYDDFTIHASVADKPDSKRAADNRETLIRAMEQYGFRVMPSEWWHYDYENWQRYPLMDISLETLETRR